MTTQELFEKEKVTLEMLDERSDESAYWLSCRNFITQKCGCIPGPRVAFISTGEA